MANIKFQNAIAQIPQATPPVWFMRQAGRYHSHYRALREKHSFMDLCKIPELAAEVAMGPIRDFDFDVSILFSDLLFPLEALGFGLSYEPAPKLAWQLTPENINKLLPIDDALPSLQFQAEAVRATRSLLPPDKSLIGFVGGAWTLYVYAVEGGHAGSLSKSKGWLPLFSSFCERLLPLLEENIALQLNAGAELVMLFDTAAGELSPALFQALVVPTLERLAKRFPKKLGYYSKGTQAPHLEHNFFQSGLLAGLGLDHRWELPKQFKKYPGFLQGNFDQSLLFLSPHEFNRECSRYLDPFKKLSQEQRSPWVSALGHGVLPATPEDNVKRLISQIRENFR